MWTGAAFQCLGYNFAYRHVAAKMYLLPQRRNRVWMWAIRKDMSAAPAASRVNEILKQLEQPEPAPLSAFLQAEAGGHCPRQELNAREEEAVNDVLSSRSVLGLGKKASEGLVIDISKSAGRAPWCAGATPCVLPKSRLYWRHVQCVLGPREVAALQGIWPADFSRPQRLVRRQASLTCCGGHGGECVHKYCLHGCVVRSVSISG